MALRQTPIDDNQNVLHGHGSGLYTKRFASIDTTGTEIFLEVDSKSCFIHQEGSTAAIYVLGTITGSATAYLTSDGVTLADLAVAKPGSVSVWSDTLGTAIDLADYTVRQLITGLTHSGKYIRLTFTAQSGQALVIDNVAIVEQDSDQDGLYTPTEVLFQGSSGFSISAGASIVSDELEYTVDFSKNYLVVMDIGSSGQVNHVTTGGSGYWKKAASNSYNASTLSGSTEVASATACIVNIGVSDEPTTICTVKAPASTINVSVLAWR